MHCAVHSPITLTRLIFPPRPRHACAAAAAVPTPRLTELLRRTEEKKEERVKERLDDYNRRNFKDYFDVVDKGYNGREISENDQAIRAQLKKWNEGGK